MCNPAVDSNCDSAKADALNNSEDQGIFSILFASEQLQYSDIDNPVMITLNKIQFGLASKIHTLHATINVMRQELTRFNPRVLYKQEIDYVTASFIGMTR